MGGVTAPKADAAEILSMRMETVSVITTSLVRSGAATASGAHKADKQKEL